MTTLKAQTCFELHKQSIYLRTKYNQYNYITRNQLNDSTNHQSDYHNHKNSPVIQQAQIQQISSSDQEIAEVATTKHRNPN